MKIHEYQAKEILKEYGIPIPRGSLVSSPEEAGKTVQDLGAKVIVVKAQVHAGGRGKGGGVRLVRSPKETEEAVREILSRPLVTRQTGPQGKVVRKILLEEGCSIEREHYAGIALDRKLECPVIMVCEEGGVEIEEVARRSPEKIIKEAIDPAFGLENFQARRLALALNLRGPLFGAGAKLLMALSRTFVEKDASLAEINPLVVTASGELIALDAKMNFDDNGLYRHPEIANLRDPHEEDPKEMRAKQSDLNYISLQGNIGCMVNGAGLAMATMDIIKLHGGEPANFLDVGGGATKEAVCEGFKILLEDPNVRAVLVNIFGGIMRCDVIAGGIVEAIREVEIKVPLVVRLEGTKVREGRAILKSSGLSIIAAENMKEAAQKAVAAAREWKAFDGRSAAR